MSELKYQLMLNKEMSWVPCYLKSEADKVIAHHKFKRCLAMAMWCKLWYEKEEYEWQLKDVHHWFKMSFYEGWYKRWLELAKKFKEEQ